MIRRILALFGYVRIPLEVVQFSLAQEVYFEKLLQKAEPDSAIFRSLQMRLKGQKVLTSFLRSGRMLQ